MKAPFASTSAPGLATPVGERGRTAPTSASSRRTAVYWTTTLVLAAWMGFAAFGYFSGQPAMVGALERLGYPDYFPGLLGTAKILGVLAILLPGMHRLREWAYAGFVFVFMGAVWSHLAAGEAALIFAPLAALALVVISYVTLPVSRIIPRPLS